jgi:hypothetical protein
VKVADGLLRSDVAALALVMAAAVAGCGGSDDDAEEQEPPQISGDQRGILGTIDSLEAASRSGDADQICEELFTEGLVRSIRRASGHSCQAEVSDTLMSPDAQFSVSRNIEVNGPRAKATIREQNGDVSTIRLVKEGGSWRIEGVTPRKQS